MRALVLLLLLYSCKTTNIEVVGSVDAHSEGLATTRLETLIEESLNIGRVYDGAAVKVDRAFEEVGFSQRRRPLVVVRGDQTVAVMVDDEASPRTRLFLSVPSELVTPGRVLVDGEFIPYADILLSVPGADRPHRFAAVCKGGRGRITVDDTTKSSVSGSIALTVSCRTYIDGREREESDLSLSGPFELPRVAK